MIGVYDLLGATHVESGQVFIDQTLAPGEHPEKEGRYFFTIGHEVGHWQLHRHFLMKDPAQGTLFDHNDGPSIICRTSRAEERIERQADIFSAALLMPRQSVLNAWQERFGQLKPIRYEYFQDSPIAKRPPRQGLVRLSTVLRDTFEPEDQYLVEQVAREFAPLFKVSILAMRIRLEKLGLLLRKAESGGVLF